MNAVCINFNNDEKMNVVERIKYVDASVNSYFFSTFNAAKYCLEINIIDIVLLDITGSNLNWKEDYYGIKLIDNAIAVVLISDNILEAVKAYDIGAFDFLSKPIGQNQLQRVFEKASNYFKQIDNVV